MGQVDQLPVYLQACLGLSAQSGSHVVQVTTKGANNKTITTPIVNLGPGTLQVGKLSNLLIIYYIITYISQYYISL